MTEEELRQVRELCTVALELESAAGTPFWTTIDFAMTYVDWHRHMLWRAAVRDFVNPSG